MKNPAQIIQDYQNLVATGTVTNFMGGSNFQLNPLQTLKMIAASSIFGEPSYYEPSRDRVPQSKSWFSKTKSVTREELFEQAVDKALDYDFGQTLQFLAELRNDYNMRLNPQVAMVRAAIHPKRVEFNASVPGHFRSIGDGVIARPDDIKSQFDYWMWKNGSKNKLPNILKRIWAKRLGEFSYYQMAKYQSKGLRDLVRISHAKGDVVNQLMKTQGSLPMAEDNSTWERLRSQGMPFSEIVDKIKMPHMALLRNLRNIFSEDIDAQKANKVLELLVSGVPFGRQFPFRYYTAFDVIKKEQINHKDLILSALEGCIDVSMLNFPVLKGKTMALSDNSGSAWGALTTEFGTTKVADIGNLSALMIAKNSEDGSVAAFGDGLLQYKVRSDIKILEQKAKFDSLGQKVGTATEHGIWLFFDQALKKKEHYDNIFIFSDQQAGYGHLYGFNDGSYKDYVMNHGSTVRSQYIDVLKLVSEYRRQVNPRVNVFSIQTAGYDNNILPDNSYRTAILQGWTGKEAVFADAYIKLWDQIEGQQAA